MIIRLALTITLVSTAVFVVPAEAQQADTAARADTTQLPDTVYTVEGLRVEVNRPVATAGGASAIRTRLDSARTAPAPTLEEVLRVASK